MERKRFKTINGSDFIKMIVAGKDNLNAQVKQINALNVFPVPDGDTGTNMSMTFQSGYAELEKKPETHLGRAAETLSKGLLMGARGNSGVILSQLFRGFAKHVQDHAEIDADGFAAALQHGVDTAYKAVVKPVEGTILTVSKEAARAAVKHAKKSSSIAELMRKVFDSGQEALNRTPELLPVLKQVGVVDAGGQGLLVIYEGFLSVLEGKLIAADKEPRTDLAVPEHAAIMDMQLANQAHRMAPVQAQMSAESIEHGYCTEFLLVLDSDQSHEQPFEEAAFRNELGDLGDSLLVVADDNLVKVHIHAEYPGSVMNVAMKYGALTRIKIENMREQHEQIVHQATEASPAIPVEKAGSGKELSVEQRELKRFGFVTIAAGEGISDIFASLGADIVVNGGQTMNPSTEEIAEAIKQVQAETVFVLPNNSNIILAANQAAEWVEEKKAVVIPSKTVPQGLAALLAFSDSKTEQDNTKWMNAALSSIRTGQITYAVRDTELEHIHIKKDDFIGLLDNRIVVSAPGIGDACRALLDKLLADGGDIITIYEGEGAFDQLTDEIVDYLEQTYPQVEVEVHPGGQPVYSYIFSME